MNLIAVLLYRLIVVGLVVYLLWNDGSPLWLLLLLTLPTFDGKIT